MDNIKLTAKVLREVAESINKTLDGQELRASRNLEEKIVFDLVEDGKVAVLDNTGMTTREAWYFLKGIAIDLKKSGAGQKQEETE